MVVAIRARAASPLLSKFVSNPAGTAAGANINAAKLGIRTAAVACLGEDEKADFILASYARLGIDCSLIQRTALKETSATILPDSPQRRTSGPCTAGARLTPCLSVKRNLTPSLTVVSCITAGPGCWRQWTGDRARGCCRRPKRAESPPALTLSPRMKRPSNYCGPCCRRWIISCLRWRKPPSLRRDAAGGHRPLLPGARRGHLHSERRRERLLAYRPRWRAAAYCAVAGRGGGYHRLRRQLLRRVYCRAGARGLSVKAACDVASAVAALVATGMGSDAGVVDWEQTQAFMAAHRP